MFMMVDYVREMTVKMSCMYGKYGSFEHLLYELEISVIYFTIVFCGLIPANSLYHNIIYK